MLPRQAAPLRELSQEHRPVLGNQHPELASVGKDDGQDITETADGSLPTILFGIATRTNRVRSWEQAVALSAPRRSTPGPDLDTSPPHDVEMLVPREKRPSAPTAPSRTKLILDSSDPVMK